MILERNKWTNPCNAFNQTHWGGNEDMVELKFLIAFFLAFTAGILAIKLGQALYDWFFLLFLAWPMARPRKAEKISHTELFLTKWTIRLTGLFFIQLNNCNIHYIADTICTYYGIHLYSTIHFVIHELFHLGEMAERTKAADC